jgi:hypothetical protein
MRELLRKVHPVGIVFRDAILALIGQRRITLGDWPDQGVVEAAIAAFEEFGGRRLEHNDTELAFDVENIYFQVRGHRVRLCVEEYGEISLWGAKGIVADLARRVAERLSRSEI